MRTSSCLHLGRSSSKARGSNTFPDSTWAPAAQPENCPKSDDAEHIATPEENGGKRVMRGGARTDFGALLQDADGEVGVSGAAELLQPDRGGEPRGPGAHDDHVVAQRLPPAAEPPSCGAPARREVSAAGRSGRCPRRRRRQRSPCRSRGFPDGPLHCSLSCSGARGVLGFLEKWGRLAVRRRRPGRHGSVGRGVALCWVFNFTNFFFVCLDWIGLDEIAEVDGPTETKTNSSIFLWWAQVRVARPVPWRPKSGSEPFALSCVVD